MAVQLLRGCGSWLLRIARSTARATLERRVRGRRSERPVSGRGRRPRGRGKWSPGPAERKRSRVETPIVRRSSEAEYWAGRVWDMLRPRHCARTAAAPPPQESVSEYEEFRDGEI